MRVDLFLKLSGLLKTRSIAGRACSGGYVQVNGRTAKPSQQVSEGDMIRLEKPRGDVIRAEVQEVPISRQVSRKDRGRLYRLLGPEVD